MKRAVALLIAALAVVLAVAVGLFALASGPGREFLRVQTERALAELLEGQVAIDEVELVFRDGLGLRGRNVRVYPSTSYPGMRADEVTIELREWGLAAADLELSALRISGFELRVTLDESSTWSFPPLRALQKKARERPSGDWSEPLLIAIHGLEEVTRYLLEEERFPDVIVIEQAQVHFIDRSLDARMREGMAVQHFQLRDASARLDRPWFREGGALALAGNVVGPLGREVPITWTGFGDENGIHSTVETAEFDLDVLDGYVQGISPQADIEGTVTARFRIDSPEAGVSDTQFEAALAGFVPTVIVANDPVPLKLPIDRIHARVSSDPSAARIHEMQLSGPRVTLTASGRVERPIRASSLAHLDLSISGPQIDDVTPLVRQLPRKTVEALTEWFDRLESGTCDSVSVSGTTRLSQWGELAGGELTRLPRNFLMSLRVSDVTARLDEGDVIEGASFEADWTADRMELRRGAGTWRGEPLPEINLAVDGFSRLVGMRASQRQVQVAPTPGAGVLWDLFVSGDEDKDEAPSRFQVEVDFLEHPILRWPVDDATIVVTPTSTGSEARVLGALWGGQPVRADVLYQAIPEQKLVVGLEAIDEEPAPISLLGDDANLAAGEWGRGRFRLEPHDPVPGEEPAMLSTMAGNFSLVGSEVRLTEMDLLLSSAVHASSTLTLRLGERDRIGVDLTGQFTETSCDGLGQLAGMPSGFVTGAMDAFLDISGYLERDAPLLAGLKGTIVASAEDGEIRQRVPIAVSLAMATDGFNPFARREALEYETLEAELGIDGGILTARRLEIEGPVRVFATGTLDLLQEEQKVDAVVGVFLLQRIREFLGKVPLVSWVIPGSDRGFIGAYFRVTGSADEPEVETMAMKTFREELPDVISAPIDVIEWLWDQGTGGSSEPPQEQSPTAEAERETVVR